MNNEVDIDCSLALFTVPGEEKRRGVSGLASKNIRQLCTMF